MLTLLAAAVIAQAPDLASDVRLDSKVSYLTGGEKLSKALAEISRSTGLSLSVAHPFDEDIVALRLANARLRDVMEQIAATLKLEWRPTGKGYSLVQSSARSKKAADELNFERIGRLRALKAEHEARFRLPRPDFDELERRLAVEQAEPLPDPNKDWKTYNARARELERLRDEGDPSLWFASAVIATLTERQMRELLDNGAITFADKPNRLQHALPKQAHKDVDGWARRNAFENATGYARIRMVDDNRVKVSVSISAEGRRVGSHEHFLDLHDSPLPPNARDPMGTRLDGKLDIEGYLGGRWGMQNSRMPNEKVMANLIESYFTPEKREPLSTMAGDGLVEIASETGNQMVALLGDDMIALGSQVALPTNGRQLLAQFCDDVRAIYTETQGWITVAPRELSLSRAKQFPRKYFAEVAAITKSRLLPLADIARIVGECTDLQLEGRFFKDYLTLATARQEFTLLGTWGDISALRLWNSLSDAEMSSLNEGGIRIGALDAGSRSLLWRAVSLGGTTGTGEGAFIESYRNPINHDPTIAFPNGWPQDEVLEGHSRQDDCVLSSFGPEGMPPMWVSLSVGRFAGYAEPNKADMSKIRIGRSFKLALVVDKLTWHADFRQDVYDFSKPMISWSEAPEALRKRYEEAKRNPPPGGYIIR
jgi:hypothetical protein